MRVTLERKDLLAILSKALRYDIQDEDVTINADPFEVHIKQLPIDELKPASIAPVVEEESQTAFMEVDSADEQSPEEAALLTMEQVLAQNNELSQDSSRTVGETPPLNRPLGPEESEEPPPITEDELRALTR